MKKVALTTTLIRNLKERHAFIPVTLSSESMEIRFDGKVAIVTGAGKGIGRDITIKLAECGAEVIAVSRTQSDLDELAEICPNIRPVCLDVGDWEQTKGVISELGPVDLLVNNAAVGKGQPLGDVDEEFINSLFEVNFKSIVNISQEVFKGMKEKGEGGSIVNISSISSLRGFPNYGVYGATKAATDSLTRNMAVEFGPYGVRVNSVNPTFVRTKMAEELLNSGDALITAMKERTPLRRFDEVEDVSYPVLFLLSDKAAMISGLSIPIDGGFSVTF